MAGENKNQDSEEKKQSSSEDDFGLPDFEFEALEDDDDDDGADADPVAEESTSDKTASESEVIPKSGSTEEEVPSIDVDDFEDIDLEGIEDVDLGEIGDLGDLGDLDLDDLDLDDLDLGDLDKELDKIDTTASNPSREEKMPVPASADKIEDIFDEPAPKEESSTEEPASEIEDDGLFYEEESFEDFDMNDAESADTATPGLDDSTDSDFDLGDDTADGVFDDDDAPDVSFDGEDDPVPFADRPVKGAGGLSEKELSEEYGEVLVDEDSSGAKSKFVRIVVIGVVLFISVGFGFLYLNGTLFGDEEPQKVAKNTTKKIPAKQTDTSTKQQIAKEGTTAAKKEKTKPIQKTPKKTPKKKPTTKITTSAAGVATLTAKTGKSYIVVGSFVDTESATKYANKLASKGQSPTIIPPFGRASNYRVAVASFASFSAAEQKLSGYRQQLGSSVWVLRY